MPQMDVELGFAEGWATICSLTTFTCGDYGKEPVPMLLSQGLDLVPYVEASEE